MKRLEILGIPVTAFDSYSLAADYVLGRLNGGRRTFCVAINPEKMHRALAEPRLSAILREADMGLCDGIGIVIAARLLHGQRIRRCTGVGLFFELLRKSAERAVPVFFLGATAESNRQACETLTRRYPGLRIVGSQDGYFEDSASVVREINESGAHCLFVALGSPRQEFWISKHLEELDVPFCMGIGGSLDVASGGVNRAPGVFRKTGTEFLYRLTKEPRRWRRQVALPLFLHAVLREKLFPSRRLER